MHLDDWSIVGTDQSLDQTVRHTHFFTLQTENRINPFRVFASASQHGGKIRIPIAGGKEENVKSINSPLFGGRLTSKGIRPASNREGARQLDLLGQISLNPTQYALQQPAPLSSEALLGAEPVLFKQTHSYDETHERILVAADNVLIGDTPVHVFRPDCWLQHVEHYLTRVIALLSDNLREGAENAAAELTRSPETIQLKTVETYFEFYAHDPILEVLRISQTLRRNGTTFARRDFATNPLESDAIDHSPRLLLHLEDGSKIRIYAKTTRRIRFEVELKKSLLKRALGELRGRQPLRNWTEMLRRAANFSASQVNRLFQSLAEVQHTASQSATPQALLDHVYAAAQTTDQAQAIIRMLAARLTLTNWPNAPLAQVIAKLRRTRVLSAPLQNGRRRIYLLSPEYRQPARTLARAFGYLNDDSID